MTLAAADIETLRRFLGYPAGADYVQAIADRCAQVLSPESEATVKQHLRELGRLQQQITNTVPFAAETFNSGAGGTRQYAPGQRLGVLHEEANRYIDELASTIRMAVYRRIYGGNGGSRWSGGVTMRG